MCKGVKENDNVNKIIIEKIKKERKKKIYSSLDKKSIESSILLINKLDNVSIFPLPYTASNY